MKKRTVLLALSLVSLFVMALAPALEPSVAYAADPKDVICDGIQGAGGGSCGSGGTTLTNVIENVINIFSIIIGVVAVIMIMVAGFKYVTAAGDSGNITSAKHTLIYAIVGLIIVALAQFIVMFVLDNIK